MQTLDHLQPKTLDIYIPTYLRPRSTAACLEHLRNKGYLAHPDINVIVSENCFSNSPSSYIGKLLLQFPEIVGTSNDTNRGFGFAVAKAFVITRSTYLWILGSDDIPLINASSLLDLASSTDLLTSYDCSIFPITYPTFTLTSGYDYLNRIAEYPFGFISATIISRNLLSRTLQYISPLSFLKYGACPHSIVYVQALASSSSFCAIPSRSSDAFVGSNRISDETYAHLSEEGNSTGIRFSKGPGRSTKLWLITLANLSSIPAFQCSDESFKTLVYRTYKRNLLIPYLTLFSSSLPYNPEVPRHGSVLYTLTRRPVICLKIFAFIFAVYNLQGLFTLLYLLTSDIYFLRLILDRFSRRLDSSTIESNCRFLNTFPSGGLWNFQKY
jgi:hypothetical protein